MPAKKKAAKKGAKKAAAPHTSMSVKLTRAHHAKAKDCLAKSGKIRLSMKEISVSKLPRSLKPHSVIMD